MENPGQSGGRQVTAARHEKPSHARTSARLLTRRAAALLVCVALWLPGCAHIGIVGASSEILWRGRTNKKVVALTLDDGPNPKYTPGVLRFAREHHVKLTFFLLGREVQRYPDLARQEARDGHVIGNHGWDHELLIGAGDQDCVNQIRRCEQAVSKACHVRTSLFRPPKGQWDRADALAIERLGYRMVLWTVTVEHKAAKTPQEMADRVISRVTPGAIILAHDGEPRPPLDRHKTLAALPMVVEGLRKKGYTFITVPELIDLSRQERK